MVLEFLKSEEDMGCGDSFAERAEWYYQKRPQLLALLRDLYSGYTALLDRCSRMERGKKLSNHFSSPMLMALDDDQDQEGSGGSSSSQFLDWDVESSLSYQHAATPIQDGSDAILGVDEVVADLVMKNVENDILADQLGEMEKNQQGQESIWRKVELLKKLLEVLESERIDLQGQIYGLEMRNKEYYQQLLKKELQERNISCTSSSTSSRKDGGVAFVGCCFQIEKLKLKKKDGASVGKKWWRNVKNMNLFMCGFQ
ncbi:kinase-interacting family protein [Salix suchowensis]|nr:kinase-interacting family protein [Salix suchowensis]